MSAWRHLAAHKFLKTLMGRGLNLKLMTKIDDNLRIHTSPSVSVVTVSQSACSSRRRNSVPTVYCGTERPDVYAL